MHETMVAQSLLNTILAEAQKQSAKPIEAKISCGMFNAINASANGGFYALSSVGVGGNLKAKQMCSFNNCYHFFLGEMLIQSAPLL